MIPPLGSLDKAFYDLIERKIKEGDQDAINWVYGPSSLSVGEVLDNKFSAGHKTPAPGYEWRDGKLVPVKRRQSVSAKIRQRKSKKVTPTRRVKGSQAP